MKIPMAMWARLMPLLDQALDVPADQREAWLQQQNLDDDAAAALRQLLADRNELDSGDFMAELPKLDQTGHTGSASSTSNPGSASGAGRSQSGLFAGDLLGPYRLIKQLGQGGMSVVWLAERDDGQMRRHVALKMPHAGPGQALLAERLRRERDILASLEHRHIARLYDVGTTSLGLPFLVLEYIEGQPLPDYCDEHKLGLHERLKLFLQVLSAVQYAHTKLVLHRDLKPSNIMVNQQGEVKLLDFGIAKLIRDSETGAAPSTELTQHSGHVLTPDYAAPEQIAGAPLTTASDVYALGVILFELLTGQRPYRLPRGTRGALEEAILATDPRRPSQVWQDADVQTHHMSAVTLTDLAEHYKSNPRRLSQLLRGDLDVIVATALQKQAARRYPTAEAFAQDITHHLAKEPIAAQPDSRVYRTRKYVQRHAWALTAVGAVVVALSVGLGLALWQAKEARQEAAKANAIKDFLVGLFENGDVEQADALRKRQQTVEQLLVNSANALGTQLKDQPQVRVELQGVVGGLLHNLAITDAAIQLRKQRVEQLEAMGASVAERAQALRDLADSQDARGEIADAKASLDSGLALCRTVSMKPADVCYGIQVAIGQLAIIARDVPVADRFITSAYDELHVRRMDSPQWAEALVAKGDLLSLQNDNDKSFELYEEAMAVRARLWGAQSVLLAKSRYELAMSLAQVGRFAQAMREMKQAYQVMVAALGKQHFNSACIELQLGLLQASIGVESGGDEHVKHATEIILAEAGSVDKRMAFYAHSVSAKVALYDGRFDLVPVHLQEAIRLQNELRDRIPMNGHLQIVMAWYLDDVGQHIAARALLTQTRDELLRRLGEHHPYVSAIEDGVMGSYLAEGRWKDAEQWFRSVKGREVATWSDALDALPSLLMEKGKFAEAETLLMQRFKGMQATPRENQYRVVVYTLYDQMGRMQAGLKKWAEAKTSLEIAIQTLSTGNPANPYLATSRARYGLCLLMLGDRAGAFKQANLSSSALKVQRQLSSRFAQPLNELMARLNAAP
jgi:serine/threonine protein kinase